MCDIYNINTFEQVRYEKIIQSFSLQIMSLKLASNVMVNLSNHGKMDPTLNMEKYTG